MDNKKDLLIASAARLYCMGIDLEAARARLRQLVEQGVPYHSDDQYDTTVTFAVLHCARKQKTEADRPRKPKTKRR